MSDWAWIAVIIIVYMVVVKPMMGGMVQKPVDKGSQTRTEVKKPIDKTYNSDKEYVDYEEVKE